MTGDQPFAGPLVCGIARRLGQSPTDGLTALSDHAWLVLLALLQVAAPFLPPRVFRTPTIDAGLEDFSTFLASDDVDAWRAVDRLAGARLTDGDERAGDAQRQLRGVLDRVWVLEGSLTIR